TSLIASMLRPNDKRIYNLADGNPCASGDVTRYACKLLQVEPPTPIKFEDAQLSDMARSFYSECKILETSRLRNELLVNLRYPSYKEGLRQILQDIN
ncbi:MAG: SDR family NAD(P)-dependent oxidoreductase, partial [Pseudomonadota bacterium]|nr:SDR family NAD(P)-dependent oxidoreductase [Pseudomonadota bacterium]